MNTVERNREKAEPSSAHLLRTGVVVMDVTCPEYQDAPDFPREPVRAEQKQDNATESAPPGPEDQWLRAASPQQA
jgi:hypothetical protein